MQASADRGDWRASEGLTPERSVQLRRLEPRGEEVNQGQGHQVRRRALMGRRRPATSGEFLDVPQIPVPARRPLVAKEIIKSDERHLDTAIAASHHAHAGFGERYAIDAIEQIDPHRFDADRNPPTIM